jgi:hypothetical protein
MWGAAVRAPVTRVKVVSMRFNPGELRYRATDDPWSPCLAMWASTGTAWGRTAMLPNGHCGLLAQASACTHDDQRVSS